MSLLVPDTGLLFWMVLAFGVVFIILAKYGFPVIIKMVEGRKEYIDRALEAAQEANRQLAGIKVDGEKILTEARMQQTLILNGAVDTRNRIISEAKEQAQIEARQQLEEVKKLIQLEKEEAVRDIRRQVALLSVDIAEKVLRMKLDDEQEQMDMIERLLHEYTVTNS